MLFRSLLALAVVSPLGAQTAATPQPAPAAKAAHPDFSGSWVLDATKTVADGPLPAPTAATMVVVHHGDSLTIDRTSSSAQGDVALKTLWGVDGYTWINYISYQGTDMTLSSVLRWDGPVLAIHTTSDFQGTPVDQSETWALSADGKMLTASTTTNVGGAYYASVTLVFSRK